jgi:chromosome segregation and condensation protein ScpB/DNA-binding XRE family transcriptional regulator
MSTTGTPGSGSSITEELRRRRKALGWTLQEVGTRAQLSVAQLSLIERGQRQPSIRSWGRIRQVLGIAEALPREAWGREVGEITEDLVATLGACLAAVRQATLAELAEASTASIAEVRLALRRLAERVEPVGMQVLDDGNAVQLAPLSRFGPAVRQLTEPRRHPGLTPDQAEVLAIVIAEGMATRSHIEHVRGFSQSRIGPEGVTMIPRDCSETLALLVSGRLLAAERDDNAQGRPNIYRPTTHLLQAFGVQTLEELRELMAITKPPGAPDLWIASA